MEPVFETDFVNVVIKELRLKKDLGISIIIIWYLFLMWQWLVENNREIYGRNSWWHAT